MLNPSIMNRFLPVLMAVAFATPPAFTQNADFAEWNADQSIMTALPSSFDWFSQELALRVGNQAYLSRLKAFGYGNMLTGPKLDSF